MVALAEEDSVRIPELIGDVAVLVVPESISVGRIDTGEPVHVELSERVAHHEFGVGVGVLIFIDPVVEFRDAVEVVARVEVDVPAEAFRADEGRREVDLRSGIDHLADVLPAVAEAVGLGVGEGNCHQHVGGEFRIEFEIHVQPVPEAGMQAEIAGPATLPAEVLIAGLDRGHRSVPDIVAIAADEFKMLIVRNGGVA